MRRFAALLLLMLPLLAACAAPAPAPPMDAGLPPPALGSVGQSDSVDHRVDYSCSTDADCTVKNVGNCCGYYPACVNVDSPTFPDLVMERCREAGMSSVCGFPEISACSCVDGRCEAADGGGHPYRIEIE